MPTITPTVNVAKALVRVDVDFTDTDAPYCLVQRVDSSTGATAAVRPHGVSTSSNGTAYSNMYAGYRATLYDAEAPLDTPFYYTATAPAAVLNVNTAFPSGQQEPWVGTLGSALTVTPVYFSSIATWRLAAHGDGVIVSPQMHAELVPATAGAILTATMGIQVGFVGTQSLTVGIAWYDATQTVISSAGTTQSIANTAGIVAVTYTATAPANTAYARMFLQLNSTPATANVVYLTSGTLTSAAATATSGAVLVSSNGACWLKDPLRPANNVRVDLWIDPNPTCTPSEGVFFMSLDPEQMPTNSASFNVNNSPTPIVVSRVRSSDTSKLTLVCRTFADRDRLRALLAPGSPLLWQVPDEYGSPDRYLNVGAVDITRVHPDHRFPVRVVALPFSVAGGVVGPSQGVAGARWQDTCDVYAGWGAVNGAGITWVQVLDGVIG